MSALAVMPSTQCTFNVRAALMNIVWASKMQAAITGSKTLSCSCPPSAAIETVRRSEERRVGKGGSARWRPSRRRRHTRCLSDWSSDVCSSDLDAVLDVVPADVRVGGDALYAVHLQRPSRVDEHRLGLEDAGRNHGFEDVELQLSAFSGH